MVIDDNSEDNGNTIKLQLGISEALVLYALLGNIGGPMSGARSFTTKLYTSLQKYIEEYYLVSDVDLWSLPEMDEIMKLLFSEARIKAGDNSTKEILAKFAKMVKNLK